jgi:UDP-glucose 4-epimerase
LKVLVTGGAGYIGSHAVRELRDAGHEVALVDDFSLGHRAAVPAGVALLEGDIGDRGVLGRALASVDAVMHFAARAYVGESVREPGAYYRTNLVKALELLAAMLECGVRRLIFSSTCAVYGNPRYLPIDEVHPTEPINPYGATKRAFERALEDHAAAGLLRVIALRYFNAAGCHEDGSLGEDHGPEPHLVPLAIDAALGRGGGLTIFGQDYDTPDGTCIRDYVHVQDLARAHVQALGVLERADPFRVFNLGTERGASVREVVAAVEKVTGKPVPATVGARRPGDPARLVAAAGRARAELGFQPRFAEIGSIVETAYRWRLTHPKGYASAA